MLYTNCTVSSPADPPILNPFPRFSIVKPREFLSLAEVGNDSEWYEEGTSKSAATARINHQEFYFFSAVVNYFKLIFALSLTNTNSPQSQIFRTGILW